MNKKFKFSYISLAITMFIIVVAWFLFDRFTKIYFDSGQFYLGQQITDSFLGIFHFTLVHNTGAAFGMFGNATSILAVFSILISLFLIVMPFVQIKRVSHKKSPYRLSFLHVLAASLVISGGIGNAIDRIANGFVVDFICFDFIDFPVFNIADIGVTCGVVLLLIAMFLNIKRTKR